MSRNIHKIQIQKKLAYLCAGFALAIIIGVGGLKIAQAEWREPDQRPTLETFSEPLTTGGENQAKSGRLELDPSYEPTEDTSLIFDPQKPLDVKGSGAKFSTSYLYNDVLVVNRNSDYLATFYANKDKDWVGIGAATTGSSAFYKMTVDNGTVQAVSTADAPITGRAVSGVTSGGNNIGIYGEASTLGGSGVYGLRANGLGQAIKGFSNSGKGVYGKSESGEGIKAVTGSASAAAIWGKNSASAGCQDEPTFSCTTDANCAGHGTLKCLKGLGWAGYFDGRLGAGSDVVAKMFLPTTLQNSLMSFSSGQLISSVQSAETVPSYAEMVRTAFDGTNIWVAVDMGPNDNSVPRDQTANDADADLFKFRAADGKELLAVATNYNGGGVNGDVQHIRSIVFDGENIWVGDRTGHIARHSIVNGQKNADMITLPTVEIDSLAYSYQMDSQGNMVKYIWATSDSAGGHVYRINAETHAYTDIPLAGSATCWGAIFDGSSVWALRGDLLYKISGDPPATTSYQLFNSYATNGRFPEALVFDGEYIWVANYGSSSCSSDPRSCAHLERLYADDPDDPQHPKLDINLQDAMSMSNPHIKSLTFDGTYIWMTIGNVSWDSENGLIRFPAAINSREEFISKYTRYNANVLSHPGFATFDGTNLWVSTYDASGRFNIDKIYSGKGLGKTDQNTLINLSPLGTCVPSFSTGSIIRSCRNNSDCAGIGDSVCNLSQSGSFNISGSADIGQGLIVTGDVAVTNNKWGNGDGTTDETFDVDGSGAASCQTEGTYMKGIRIGGDSKISQIVCDKL